VAWAAAVTSAPGEVCVVPSGREAAFLAPLDLSLLPCSPVTLRRLGLLGLRTIDDLASLPLGAVQASSAPKGDGSGSCPTAGQNPATPSTRGVGKRAPGLLRCRQHRPCWRDAAAPGQLLRNRPCPSGVPECACAALSQA
jgi:hypothetical protein